MLFRYLIMIAVFLNSCHSATKPKAASTLATTSLQSQDKQNWRQASPEYKWDFPKDHYQHPGFKTEWWYFTGHLESKDDSDTTKFGFQLTFFKVGIRPKSAGLNSNFATDTMVMAHFAITDKNNGLHRFSENLLRTHPSQAGFGEAPDRRLVWIKAPPGSNGIWWLDLNETGFHFRAQDDVQQMGLDIKTTPKKPLIYHGDKGFSQKSHDPQKGSLYYSFTRMTASGHLSLNGKTYKVEGQSWMDKEIGSTILGGSQVGWDWFSIQWLDGSELMLFHLRQSDGKIDFARTTTISSDGQTQDDDGNKWILKPVKYWASPNKSRYPTQWMLTGPRGKFSITTPVEHQENTSRLVPGLKYWEGAIEIINADQQVEGLGFLEMTGR